MLIRLYDFSMKMCRCYPWWDDVRPILDDMFISVLGECALKPYLCERKRIGTRMPTPIHIRTARAAAIGGTMPRRPSCSLNQNCITENGCPRCIWRGLAPHVSVWPDY